jgi:hypothetical protein
VYIKKGGKIWKKGVETGAENDEQILIKTGLEVSDRILLNPPANREVYAYLDR